MAGWIAEDEADYQEDKHLSAPEQRSRLWDEL
jgi:hypothetical protein